MQEIKKVFLKPDEMYQAAAHYLADTLQKALTKSSDKPFSVVLTGGSTPAPFYRLLASAYSHLPWTQVHFFWCDERYVSPRDRASNYKMAHETLLSNLELKTDQIHRIPTELPQPAEAATAYEKEVFGYFTRINTNCLPPGNSQSDWSQLVFNLTLLGMGPDGHIASLFPHSPALETTDKLITYLDKAPLTPQVPRITMTLPLLNNSERIVFLISGKEKMDLLRKIEKKTTQAKELYPVCRVRARKELVWFISQS